MTTLTLIYLSFYFFSDSFLNHHISTREINLASLFKENENASIFTEGVDSFPKFGKFSILPFMQKDQFDIIDEENYTNDKVAHLARLEAMKKKNKMYGKRDKIAQGNFKHYDWQEYFPYSSDNLRASATYINPELVSKEEYIKIVKCVRKAHNAWYTYNKEHYNISTFRLPTILIYSKNPELTIVPFNPRDSISSIEFDSFQCKDKKYTVNVFLNGLVIFNLAADTSYTADNFYNFPIGYLDTKANLIRDIEPYKRFVWEKKFNAKNLQEAGFAKAYKESEIVKLLFDQNQKPINNYLKNCRNKNKKTIFDAYRPEFEN